MQKFPCKMMIVVIVQQHLSGDRMRINYPLAIRVGMSLSALHYLDHLPLLNLVGCCTVVKFKFRRHHET